MLSLKVSKQTRNEATEKKKLKLPKKLPERLPLWKFFKILAHVFTCRKRIHIKTGIFKTNIMY